MIKYPKVSIIIPLYVISDRFFQDLLKFNNLNYPNYEILIICDRKVALSRFKGIKIRFILTHQNSTGPAEKRDIALKYSKGEFCAFIDDDAYPDSKWLKNAIKKLDNPYIVGVGGPGITPKEDNYWEQLTGIVYGSFFCGGLARYRFIKQNSRYVNDYPAYNLILRTKILKKVGGYGNHFYGGEDTFLCLKLIKAGHKIFYDPSIMIYHHRRPLFRPYLKQIFNIGIHRGYFFKKFPETSRKLFYLLPSIAFITLIIILLVAFISSVGLYVLATTMTLVFIVLILSINQKGISLKDRFLASIGIVLTHCTYGTGFIRGLLTSNLVR